MKNTALLFCTAACICTARPAFLIAQTDVAAENEVVRKSLEYIPLPDMETDRPDQTESSSLVPVKHLQVEIGVMTEQTTITDNGLDRKQVASAYPDVLVRYGLFPSMEFRLEAGYYAFKYNGESVSGLAPVSIGTKLYVCSEDGWIPQIAFIGHITLPNIGREEFRPRFVAPSFRFAASHTLGEQWGFGYNFGAEWDGESAMAIGIYTVVLGHDISDDMGAFVELFGDVSELGDASHQFDGGLTYLLSSTVQADVSAGVGLVESAPDYFLSAGLSFRVPD